MRGINKCIFIGNLFADPEVKHLANGNAVTNARLAVKESWKDKNGDKHERVESVRLVFFGKLAEIAGQYLGKGSQIYAEGRLQTRKWQAQDGQDRYSTEIVVDQMQMLSPRGENRGGGGGYNAPAAREQAPAEPFDDDVPFLTSVGLR